MKPLVNLRKRTFLSLCLTLCTGVALSSGTLLQADEKADPESLRVMTYNLRFAAANPLSANSWESRRDSMYELIKERHPDIIGTQEGTYRQLKDLGKALPDYQWIGLGRDGGSRGEFMAIFYRPDRFEPIAYDHFWLSETPEVIASTSWEAANLRMVTWVLFQDKQTGKNFYFWNTHLDHVSQKARDEGAKLIVQRVNALPKDVPVILTGDFNAVAGKNPAWIYFTQDGQFKDSWDHASKRINETANTFSNFQKTRFDSQRIDWILTRGIEQFGEIEIVLPKDENSPPSDHHPVEIRLKL